MKTFVTLLKREYWEHRGGFLWAPFAVVAVFLLITLMGLSIGQMHMNGDKLKIVNIPLGAMVNGIAADKMEEIATGINIGLSAMALVVQLVLGFVLFFYLLGALFDDRKDRSILFWKSLPVSDLDMVISKIVTAAIVAPCIAWVAGVVFHLLMLALLGAFLSLHDVSASKFLWAPAEPVKLWIRMLAAIPINALWALPTYGWLLLVSSWARTKPFLWGFFVPIIAGLLLAWLDMLTNLRVPDSWYWSNVFARAMFSVLPYSWSPGNAFNFGYQFDGGRTPADLISWESFEQILSSANLWIGVVAGVAMIAGAVYLRRYREIAD